MPIPFLTLGLARTFFFESATMNITLSQQNTTEALLNVTLTESDYLPKIEEKVKDYARKATIKGFRAGKVPSGVIRKMFGKSILVEEVNQLISQAVSEYIRDNKLRVLGEPMPNEEKARLIDWETQKNFEFEFQLGMVNDFAVDLSAKVKLTKYVITVDDQVLNETLEDIKQRFGTVSYPEVSEAGDNLSGELTRADGTTQDTYIPFQKIAKKEQARFVGLTKEDAVSFDPSNAFDDEVVLAQVLGLDREEAVKQKGTVTFKVGTITRVMPAELNQELFDKVFGKEVVDSEEAFVQRIKDTVAENYTREADRLLDHELQHHLVDHTNVTMPEAFLKQWLKASSRGEVTDEILEKEFKAYAESLKWDLIKNKIAEDLSIQVEGGEVREKAKQMIVEQFGGAAIAAQLGDKLDAIADNYLSGQDGKGQNFMRVYNQLRTEKIVAAIKEKVTLAEKAITLEEFRKIAASHNH